MVCVGPEHPGTGFRPIADLPHVGQYLDDLNRQILTRIEESGEAFLSNAIVHGKFALRMCIVNFRTTLQDILSLPGIVERHGWKLDRSLRPRESSMRA
jgi:hypothetical protein